MSRFRIESPARFAGSRFNGLSVWQERATSVLHLAFTSGPLVCSGFAARPIVRRGHASEGATWPGCGCCWRRARWRGSPRPAGSRTWPRRCPAPGEAGNPVAVVMPLLQRRPPRRRADRANTASFCRSRSTDHVWPAASSARGCTNSRRAGLPRSNISRSSSATTRARAAGSISRRWEAGYKADYPDNAERFIFFSRAVLELVPYLGFTPGRHPRQRLANRPRPGLPRGDVPAAGRLPAHPLGLHHPQHRLSGHVRPRRDEPHRPARLALQPQQAGVPRPLQLPEGRHRLRRRGEHRQPDLRPRDPDSRVRLRPRRAARGRARQALGHRQRRATTTSGTRRTTGTSPRRTRGTRSSRTSRCARPTCSADFNCPKTRRPRCWG